MVCSYSLVFLSAPERSWLMNIADTKSLALVCIQQDIIKDSLFHRHKVIGRNDIQIILNDSLNGIFVQENKSLNGLFERFALTEGGSTGYNSINPIGSNRSNMSGVNLSS